LKCDASFLKNLSATQIAPVAVPCTQRACAWAKAHLAAMADADLGHSMHARQGLVPSPLHISFFSFSFASLFNSLSKYTTKLARLAKLLMDYF
jgi:hypothetical protein